MEKKTLLRYLLVALISFASGFGVCRITTNTTTPEPVSVEVKTNFDSDKEEKKEKKKEVSLSSDNLTSIIWQYKESSVSIDKCYKNKDGDYYMELLLNNQHADEMIAYFDDTYVNDMQTGCYRTGDYVIKGKKGIIICHISKEDLDKFNITEIKTIDTELYVQCDDKEYTVTVHIDPYVFG